MPQVVVSIFLDKETCLAYYRGEFDVVLARSLDGRMIRFPARILQRFISERGVEGRFRLEYDAAGKFTGVERV